MSKLENPVLLGIVGGAHGIRGECRVRSHTDNPTDIGAYGPLSDANGKRYTVRSAREQKNVVIVRFEEVTDRNEAERLNGTELFVDRSLLPDDDMGEDFYQADLIGLDVRSTAGEMLGEVIAFHNFGAGDVLEIRREGAASFMIPFTEAAVPEIDLDVGYILVEPVSAGLEGAVEVREGDEIPSDDRSTT
ncbi:ribosome maturation factor RimM [Aureimonas fodinaquatilis]|uniref:Ribosome maturation factor RimM n=1 Tax=Aureimonas fodinaquatilis TaxID=2565783 RepID=A0A5B0DWZ6_9HYPH|nr:ribosome maturation factor RimM [Aureimonas fodinaquatilis]KAA0969729.1 ribosome maturation factor RimM [Aureimonas fodinaquatilis]